MSEHDEQELAIAAAKRGERVSGRHSLHAAAKPERCRYGCEFRTLFCNNVDDVVECKFCGRQEVTACNFDEEYA